MQMHRYWVALSLLWSVRAFAAELPPLDPKPLPAGAPLYYCAGNDVAWQPVVPPKERRFTRAEVEQAVARRVAAAKAAGITSLEVYLKWWLCEPEPGKWDFSYYDVWAKAVKGAGMRWVPLVIAGPAYGTPPWFKASPESLFARCLEHGQESRIQSIWNPRMRPRVTEFLKQLAGHFDTADIEALKLGITGDFGESIYPSGGNHWTHLDEPYHVHAGYWCGDAAACADFRTAVRRAYGAVRRLNAVWGTAYPSFDAVVPFLPSKAPSRRARLDMQRWYCASMTDYLDFWLRATREAFPKTRILVSVGGDGPSILGADFTAQAEAAARVGAGLRITNEASDYARNYMLTRQVASACRHYGTYFGIEPAGGVKDEGIVGRIYNATASGADELFTYDPEPAGERAARYDLLRPFLVKREPAVDVGLFLSRTSWDLDLLGGFFDTGCRLRAVTDFDIVDERLVAAGALQRLRVLVWTAGPVVESNLTPVLEEWVRGGGLLLVAGLPAIESVEGSRAPEQALLPPAALGGQAVLPRYRVDVGSAVGDAWLRGNWHGPENGMGFQPPDTSFRWSTNGSEVELPLPQGGPSTVAVCLTAAGPYPDQMLLLADRRPVAQVPGPGRHILRFTIGGDWAARYKKVRLGFGGPTWPADPPDTRRLGVAVSWVGVGLGEVDGDVLADAPPLGTVPGLTLERVAREYTRSIGKGAVVYVPAGDVSLEDAARAAVFAPETFLPGAKAPYPPLRGDTDGVYLTRFHDGSALLLNFTDREARVQWGEREATLPPRGIGEIR